MPDSSPRQPYREWVGRVILYALFPAALIGYVLVQYFNPPPPPPTPPAARLPEPPPRWVADGPPALAWAGGTPHPRPADGWVALVAGDGGGVRLVTTGGREVASVVGLFDDDRRALAARFSPDGMRLAVFVRDEEKERARRAKALDLSDNSRGMMGVVQVFDLGSSGPPAVTLTPTGRFDFLAWGGGDTLHLRHYEWRSRAEEGQAVTVVGYDLTTRRGTTAELPDGFELRDISADGKTLLLYHPGGPHPDGPQPGAYSAAAGTFRPTRLTGGAVHLNRLSPDGSKALGIKARDPKGERAETVVVDLATGRETVVALGDDTDHFWEERWSPDGTRLIVTRYVLPPPAKRLGADRRGWPESTPETTFRNLDGADPKPFPVDAYWEVADWR